MPALPPDSLSPMIPEPTTAATRNAVPTPSAIARRAREGGAVGIGDTPTPRGAAPVTGAAVTKRRGATSRSGSGP